MDNTEEFTTVEWCAGYGGIQLGLRRAIPNLRTTKLSGGQTRQQNNTPQTGNTGGYAGQDNGQSSNPMNRPVGYQNDPTYTQGSAGGLQDGAPLFDPEDDSILDTTLVGI